jgi:hypothetical protein
MVDGGKGDVGHWLVYRSLLTARYIVCEPRCEFSSLKLRLCDAASGILSPAGCEGMSSYLVEIACLDSECKCGLRIAPAGGSARPSAIRPQDSAVSMTVKVHELISFLLSPDRQRLVGASSSVPQKITLQDD